MSSEQNFQYKRYHIPNVVKTLKVIEVLSQSSSGLTRTEIAKATGFTESIIFRILYTMLDYGMIVKTTRQSRYVISKKFISYRICGANISRTEGAYRVSEAN